MKATLFAFCFLGFLSLAVCFDQAVHVTDFLDSQPHALVRVDFDLPFEGTGEAFITVNIVADLGNFLNYGVGPEQRNPGSSNPAFRNVKIYLRTPTGRHNLYLGKFFDEDTTNNQNYLVGSYIYFYIDPTDVEYLDNYYNDEGFYNGLHTLQFSIAPEKWIPISKEGQVSLIFEFSDEVASFYKSYPRYGYNSLAIPDKNYIQVSLSFEEAAVLGDPHFIGWNGAKFDFHGESHHIYNLISHKDTQINFQLKQRNFFSVTSKEELEALSQNTYIGTLGIKTKSHQLVLYAGDSGFDDAGYIELDGVRHQINRFNNLIHSDAELTVQFVAPSVDYLLGHHPVAAHLLIKTSTYSLRVYFIELGRSLDDLSEWHSHPFRFFDLYASINNNEEKLHGRMHGVLGQTGDRFLSKFPSGADKWSVEGVFEDYRVSDLFSNDFKFNLFAHKFGKN